MGRSLALFSVPGMMKQSDKLAPTCVVSSAAGDPVYAPFSATFTFSENVTGFVIGDITVTNGAASNFATVSGSVYTADITPTTAGAVTVKVNAGVCTDAVGNPNEASNTLTRTCGWFVMTVTTTGAQTLTINDLTVSASTTVDWGDSSSNAYTGSGLRTHNYAGAGTWTVTIKQPLNVTGIDLRSAAKISSLTGANMAKLVNLTSLRLDVGTGLVWTVNNDAPMPANITSLIFLTLVNLTWNVGSMAGANMPANITTLYLFALPNLTWNVGSVAGANMPANATSITILSTGLVTIEATDILPAPMTTFRFGNGLNQAAVDAVLAALYLAFPTRTGTAGTIDLLGSGNAAPTGVSPGSPECPPTTGWNTAYELVNDSCGVSPKHWASVSLQT